MMGPSPIPQREKPGLTSDPSPEDKESVPAPVLRIATLDPEERFGVRAGRFTDVNGKLALFFGLLLAAAIIAAVDQIDRVSNASAITDIVLERGLIPYAIIGLCCWALAMLTMKSFKVGAQRKALQQTFVPQARDFVLAPATAIDVLHRMRNLVDDPKRFVLLNRIELALSNLSNIGQVSDVAEMLTTQADSDESHMISSFSLVRGFVWAIPVLGFIGTVLGLSDAIGGFGAVLAQSSDVDKLTEALQGVTAGLAVAFDTTLLGLVVALFLQLLVTWQIKREEDFLHACNEYCHVHVLGKLRLLDVGRQNNQPKQSPEAGD